MKKFIAAFFMAMSTMANAPPHVDRQPTVDLSAVRFLVCSTHDAKGKVAYYSGSGFLIGDHILATARHVAHGDKCIDAETNTPVKMYHEDTLHDFALMSGSGLPTDIPYIKYRCTGVKANIPYMSYGITDYEQKHPLLRENTIVATENIDDKDDDVTGLPHSAGMRVFNGFIAPGMSGGPVVDISGYAVAVNNGGDDHVTLLFDLKDTVLCK